MRRHVLRALFASMMAKSLGMSHPLPTARAPYHKMAFVGRPGRPPRPLPEHLPPAPQSVKDAAQQSPRIRGKEAERAVQGRHYETGEKQKQSRRTFGA